MVSVLVSKEKHFWYSCVLLIEHMLGALSGMEDFEVVTVDQKSSMDQQAFLIQSKAIIFLGDNLCWEEIIEQNLADYQGEFIFPIFGNLTIENVRWSKLASLLNGKTVKLWVASKAAHNQASKFFKQEIIFEIPFLVKERVEPYQPSETINIIYAGRITPQKNIIELLKAFEQASKLREDLRLHLAGDFHAREFHLHSMESKGFKELFLEMVSNNSHVTYHGNLNQNELRGLMAKSDYSISVSTYHDEDFGHSIAQGALNGHGLLLSNWGGHRNYIEYFGAKRFSIKVRAMNYAEVDYKEIAKTLIRLKQIKDDERTSNRERALEYFSEKLFCERVLKLLNTKVESFEGITSVYKDFLAVWDQKRSPFSKEGRPDLYKIIYEGYYG